MVSYYDLKKLDVTKNYSEMKVILEVERKTDMYLDAIITGKGKMENTVKSIEKKFKGFNKSLLKKKTDQKYNMMTKYVLESLEMNYKASYVNTGVNAMDEYEYKSQQETACNAGAGIGVISSGAGSALTVIALGLSPFLILPGMLVGGLLVGFPLALTLGPEGKLKRARKKVFKEMKKRAKDFDELIADVYLNASVTKKEGTLADRL